MFDFFTSLYFLGILTVALACTMFCAVFFPSWYGGHPRRFWLARLTYDNDAEQQSSVRFMWIAAWILSFIGSLVIAYNIPNLPHTFWWIAAQTLYGVLMTWLIAKMLLALCILLQYIGLGFIRLKDWMFHDKPLFSKKNTLKPLNQ